MRLHNTYQTPGPRRGLASLMTVYLMAVVLLFIVAAQTSLTNHQIEIRERYEVYKDEFAAAEEALNQAFGHVIFLVSNNVPDLPTEIASTPAPVVPGHSIESFNIQQISVGFQDAASEGWPGYSFYILRYRSSVRVKKQNTLKTLERSGVGLSQEFHITYIPLFNFAIFYDPTMEIAPGPRMFVNGRVHANGDAYIQSNSGLDFQDKVTVAGGIYHGRHPDSGKSDSSGAVNFLGADGSSMVNMTRSQDLYGQSDSSGWLDSRDGDWTGAATQTWGGNVRDGTHDVLPLRLPIPPVADPHSIIERADPNGIPAVEAEKFENKAGFKIVQDDSGNLAGYRVESDGSLTEVPLSYYIDNDGDAVAVDADNPNPDPTAHPTRYVATATSFYDAREDAVVNSVDINLAHMNEYQDSVPPNGILYVSNEDQGGSPGVVRLTDGADLPDPSLAEGFTVTTDDPIYVQGDYNTIDRTLALVAGDAVYALSNNWTDAPSEAAHSMGTASDTTMNTVFINGIVPSQNNNYSGGVENYFRFLESWSGKDFNFSGSIIQLWESQQALGAWSYGSPVYKAPNRNWAWDTALGGINGPPGAPVTVDMRRANWSIY